MRSAYTLTYLLSLAKCTGIPQTENVTPSAPPAPEYDQPQNLYYGQPPIHSSPFGHPDVPYQQYGQYQHGHFNTPPPPPYPGFQREAGYPALSDQPLNPQFAHHDQPPAYSPPFGDPNASYQQYGYYNMHPGQQFAPYGQPAPQYPPYPQQETENIKPNVLGQSYPEEEGESSDKPPMTEADNENQGDLYPNLDELLGGTSQLPEQSGAEEESKKKKKRTRGAKDEPQSNPQDGDPETRAFLDEYARVKLMINATKADSERYHKAALSKNHISKDFELPFVVYDQYLDVLNPKLEELLCLDSLKTETLRSYLKNRMASHISSCFSPDEPLECIPHFRHGHRAFSFFLEELRKQGIKFTSDSDQGKSKTAAQFIKQLFMPGSKSEVRDDGHSKQLHNALERFDTLLAFLKEEKTTETNEIIPFSEICSLFVMHIDYLNRIHAFAPNSDYPDVLELIKSVYLNLVRLNYIAHSIARNWIGPREARQQESIKARRFNFLKQEMHFVLRLFNVDVMKLINLVGTDFATMEIHFGEFFRMLSMLRSCNSLYKICADLMLLSVQGNNITRENVGTFVDDIAFISSNVALYSLDERFVKTAEFTELFSLPLSEIKSSLFGSFGWPFSSLFGRSAEKSEEPAKHYFRPCADILSALDLEMERISDEYRDNEVDRRIKDLATKKKEKEWNDVIRQKFPELFEDLDELLDKMLDLVFFATGVNLSSCKSTIKDKQHFGVAAVQVKRAFKEANYSKFELKRMSDGLFLLYNDIVGQHDPTFRKISFETTGHRPILDFVFEKFSISTQRGEEYRLLNELATLEVQRKMAMIAIWIFIMTDTILIVFNQIKGKSPARRIRARQGVPRYNHYH